MMKRLGHFIFAISIAHFVSVPAEAQSADEYDVTIVFTGIVSFVPGNGSATLMMPKVSAGNYGFPAYSVPAHIAYILAHRTYMPATEPLNQDNDFDDAAHEGASYQYIELNGDQIAVDDENEIAMLNSRLRYSTNQPPTGVQCPDANTATSLYWIASEQRVFGAWQTPDKARFDPHPKKADVLARAQLLYGTLEAHVVKPGLIWEFRVPVETGPPNPPTATQALAQEVHWKFRAAHRPFVLNLLSFEGVSRRIAFQPDTNGKIVIVVGHTAFSDTGPIGEPKPMDIDYHYSLHHTSVAGNVEGRGPIPHRVASKKCEDDAAAVLYPATLQPKPAPAAPLGVAAHAHSDSGPAPSGLNCPPNNWP